MNFKDLLSKLDTIEGNTQQISECGDMPGDTHSLTPAEYRFRDRPYARGMPYRHVYSYIQSWGKSDYSRTR